MSNTDENIKQALLRLCQEESKRKRWQRLNMWYTPAEYGPITSEVAAEAGVGRRATRCALSQMLNRGEILAKKRPGGATSWFHPAAINKPKEKS